MDGRLLLQLAFLMSNEADAALNPRNHGGHFDSPPRSFSRMTTEEKRQAQAEHDRLRAIAARLAFCARELGWDGGTNMAFGSAASWDHG